MMQTKHVDVELEVKELSEDGTFKGYASVYGVKDLDGDIIEQGAFKDAKPGIPMLWQHDTRSPIGKFPVLRDEPKGVYIEGKLTLGVRQADEAYALLKDGVPLALSVGFSVPPGGMEWDDKNKVRRIKQAKLWETSIVTFPANPKAQILAVKGATSFSNLPLAPRDKAWNAGAAEKRVRAWAGAEDAPNAKYRKAFFWYDSENADNFTSYKLPFADVVGGELVAVPRAVFAAAAAIMGARGGVDIPSGDVAAVKNHIAKYYQKMSEEFDEEMIPPWEKAVDEAVMDVMKATAALIDSPKSFEGFLRDVGFSLNMAKGIASRYKEVSARDVHEDTEDVAALLEKLRDVLKS